MIEGDDLFGRNYQLLSKNFTADAIETVSLYDNYKENEILKEISESDETVLNLALKDEFKVDFFGTLTAQYDGDKNYELDGNLISITKKFKGYLFENANNIGADPSGNIYNLLRTGSSLPFQNSTPLGSKASTELFVSETAYRVSQLDQQQYLNNQTTFHASGGIYSPTDNLKIKGVGYFLLANRSIRQEFRTRYDPSLGLPDLERSKKTEKSFDAAFGKLNAKYTFSKKSNLRYEGIYKSQPSSNQSDRQFRDQPLLTTLKTKKRLWNQHLRFTHKIADKKALRLRIRYKNEDGEQNFSITPPLANGPFGNSDSTKALLQQTEAHTSYTGADITYWDRTTKSLFSIRSGAGYTATTLQNQIEQQADFTAKYSWDRLRAFSTLSYQHTIGKGLKAETQLTGNVIWNYTNLEPAIDESLFYLAPGASITYEPNDKNELTIRYQFNREQPNFHTLFNGLRLSSYQSVVQGTSDFTLLPQHIFSTSYRYGNWSDDFVLNTFFRISHSDKNYTKATTITPTYNYGTYRLQRNRRMLTSRFEVNQFLNVLQSNLAAEYTFTNASFTRFFNNQSYNIRSNSHLIKSYLRTAFVGPVNGSIGLRYNLSESTNRINNYRSQYTYLSAFANTTLNISDKFQLSAEYTFYQIENAGHYHFLNTSLEFETIEDKLTLYLDGRNLLDQTTFKSVSAGSYSQSEQYDTLNPRFVLVGVKLEIR
ncbi:TonB-dependent receptor [Fodinibius halophilus]|uniref:TonB-dependent receptor n=1 Tax=Fodinibius halophilus TaxID=1736908 RepID=A0A6M1THK8_9BACT|nr:TonB-dependent receptor [Fodinibius halophilus]NGP89592.1 TonB-dependent receptor [Fodinibius halophilus]